MSRFIAPRPHTAGKAGSSVRLTAPKPRNPLITPALMRQAGSHGRGNQRQQARRQLERQIVAELGGGSP